MIIRKSAAEIDRMARAGAVVADALALIGERAQPGVTTAELDALADEFIRSQGGVPTFLGYRGYPASVCISPNDMVVHGIPGPYVLEDGDVLSVDVGVTLDGFVADSAYTFPVGEISSEAERLLQGGQAALAAGIEQCRIGRRLSDISHAMTFAIEPMINAGGPDVVLHDDQWSISTADGSLSAHFEHTVAIMEEGPRILTPAKTPVRG